MKRKSPQVLAVNSANWSEASRRGYACVGVPSKYHDIHFKCASCRRDEVFTAAEQRNTYEVKKAYIWQRRKLCQMCFGTRIKLERELKQLQQRWMTESKLIEREPQTLERWLWLLRQLPRYGIRENTAQIAMLTRLTRETR